MFLDVTHQHSDKNGFHRVVAQKNSSRGSRPAPRQNGNCHFANPPLTRALAARQHKQRLNNHFRITDHYAIGPKGRSCFHARATFGRARIILCDAARLVDCSAGPPPSAASAAEASLPVLRSTRASFLSGVSPVPGSRPSLSRFAASDMHGPLFGGICCRGLGLRCVS